jgi:RNA polymerase primary sigma factor
MAKPTQARSEFKDAVKSRSGLEFVGNENALSTYLREIKSFRNLTHAEEKVIAQRVREGDKQALNTLVQANLKFVVAVCRNYQYQGMPLEDLINEGNLGLIRAAKRFDSSLEFKFISYAVWWIRQAILSALADQSRVMSIAPGRIGKIHRIARANSRLEQKLGRPPTLLEISESMQISVEEIHECMQLAAPSVSLDATLPGEGEGRIADSLEDRHSEKPDRQATLLLMRGRLTDLLDSLDERERDVVSLYFGLNRPDPLTLEEIAQRFDLTRERVRQIKDKTLERLRHPSRKRTLTRFQD